MLVTIKEKVEKLKDGINKIVLNLEMFFQTKDEDHLKIALSLAHHYRVLLPDLLKDIENEERRAELTDFFETLEQRVNPPELGRGNVWGTDLYYSNNTSTAQSGTIEISSAEQLEELWQQFPQIIEEKITTGSSDE